MTTDLSPRFNWNIGCFKIIVRSKKKKQIRTLILSCVWLFSSSLWCTVDTVWCDTKSMSSWGFIETLILTHCRESTDEGESKINKRRSRVTKVESHLLLSSLFFSRGWNIFGSYLYLLSIPFVSRLNSPTSSTETPYKNTTKRLTLPNGLEP